VPRFTESIASVGGPFDELVESENCGFQFALSGQPVHAIAIEIRQSKLVALGGAFCAIVPPLKGQSTVMGWSSSTPDLPGKLL